MRTAIKQMLIEWYAEELKDQFDKPRCDPRSYSREQVTEVLARWTMAETYVDISKNVRGMTVGKVAGIVNRYRVDGYSKPRGPLRHSRGRNRTGPTVREMRDMKSEGNRYVIVRREKTRTLLTSLLKEDKNAA